MTETLFYQHVIDSTDKIYNYISKRVISDENVELRQIDKSNFMQLDGLLSNKSHLTEKCYEYFLIRLPNGIKYFTKKSKGYEKPIINFNNYLFKLFLKNLVIDFNRKETRKLKRQEFKKSLIKKFHLFNHLLSERDKEIIQMYLNTDRTQKEIADSFHTSRATVNRTIKKLSNY